MAVQVEADVAKLRSDIDQLRTDISKIGDSVKTLVSEGSDVAVARFRRSADKIQRQAKDVAQIAAQEMEERPFATAAGAFGVGLMLGFLFSRR
jgi:ElaB/YqjD/DUF883 family membrane-anchored ribosome-binding protein